MNLFSAYIFVGVCLSLLGCAALFLGMRIAPMLLALPRAKIIGNLLWAIALGLFISRLYSISEVDLAGFPRWSLLLVFGGAGVLAFKYLSDLLSLRAIAVLLLFAGASCLDAGFNQIPKSIVLAGTSYLFIVIGLWVGATPFVMRNALTKICKTSRRIRLTGALFLVFGLANLAMLPICAS